MVPASALPSSLWKEERYHVSPDLQSVYERQLELLGLLELASTSNKEKQVYGGASEKETNDHYALRFSASVVRIQNVVLDAKAKFGNISTDIITSFSSHKISLLDIPCGTGAGGLSLMAILHELRSSKVIPSLPLDIRILAGDISRHARSIYHAQLDGLGPILATSGISVTLQDMDWDATDLMSTARLCSEWDRAVSETDESYVLVTNFSGAGEPMIPQFQECFRHISARAAHSNATLLWIEPGDKGGRSFLAKIGKLIGSLFASERAEEKEFPFSEAKWWHSLQRSEFTVRSTVNQYTRA